jgi:hypothetical protein
MFGSFFAEWESILHHGLAFFQPNLPLAPETRRIVCAPDS